MIEPTDGTFWMVYGWGQGAPTLVHGLKQEAVEEAARLARTNPGVRFYVLQAQEWAERKPEVETGVCNPSLHWQDEDDLPW